jgi:hypothetical protein
VTTLDELEARLSEAASSALGRSDPAAVALVRRLVARARAGGGTARDRLVHLADARLTRAIEQSEDHARRLAEAVEGLGEVGLGYREALARGDSLVVARALRRVRRGGRRLIGEIRAARSEEQEASPLPDARSVAPPPPSMHRYRVAAAEAEADLALLRSKRSLPEIAGRYHGGVVAAEALQTMERAGRGYLIAQLSRFEAYAAVLALVEELEPKATSKSNDKKKRPKRTR